MSVVTVTVLSAGQAVADSHALLSVDVRHELNRLSSAVLLYSDGDAAQRSFPLSDAGTFDTGKEVEIKARYEDDPSSERALFKGLVVRQAVEAGAQGSVLRVEMRHPAIRMTQARRSRVFKDKTDSAVLQTLIQDAGLTADVQATSIQQPGLVQFDCTDWDFALSRADANGLFVLCDAGTLRVKPLPSGGAPPVLSLDYGLSELYELEFCCDAGGQASGFKATSWSVKDQALADDQAATAPPPPLGTLSPAKASDALGLADAVLRLPADLDKPELKAWADSLAGRAAQSLVRGRAAVPGLGSVQLLDRVEIKGVPKRFAGQVPVSGLVHRIDQAGWVTDLQFGLPPQPFHRQADTAAPPAAGLLPPARGLQIGVVQQVHEDPMGEHRVLVTQPGFDQGTPGLWARLSMPEAGKDRGFYFWPEPGDEVVLGFFGEDPRAPVVLGSLFGSKNAPPADIVDASDKNNLRGLVSRAGLVIGLVDGDDKPQLYLKTPGGQRLTLDDEAQSVSIEDQHGNKLRLDKDGITLESAKDFVVKAKGKVQIEASADVAVKGSKVDLQ